jgi:transcriptional regulator with PAS, ATPase and Fis domain
VSALLRGVAPRSWLTLTASEREHRSRMLAGQMVAQSRDFFQGTLDSLVAHIAVLDAEGEIIMTNRAWARFAAENGADARADRQNYLAV